MKEFTSKTVGTLSLATGIAGTLAVITLILFFVSLFQDISSLSFMGTLNDTINGLSGILSAVLASTLHPALRRVAGRLSLTLLIGVWLGATAIGFGSWLIISGGSDVEQSSYYYFFGNGLIGIWIWVLNRTAREHAVWTDSLTRLGWIASGFMMVGLLGLVGILSGSDGGEYSPLIMINGISYLGIAILYPIWGILLGRWILSKRGKTQ